MPISPTHAKQYGCAVVIALACTFPVWLTQTPGGFSDLSTHLYNGWLANRIAEGQVHDLVLSRRYTNILFDHLLRILLHHFEAGRTEQIALSALVFTFVVGCFAFASSVANKPAWRVMPLILMTAYGRIFEIGFANFYWSVGFSFMGLAAIRKRGGWNIALGVLLFGAGLMAHPIPIVIALALVLYEMVWEHLPMRRRIWLVPIGAATLLIFQFLLRETMRTELPSFSLRRIFGVGAMARSGLGYQWLSWLLLVVAIVVAARALRKEGWRTQLSRLSAQRYCLAAIATAVLPAALVTKHETFGVSYLEIRFELICAVLLIAFLAELDLQRWEAGATALMALSGLLLLGTAFAQNQATENKLVRALQQLPETLPFVVAEGHLIDRACIARCYALPNYEASSLEFEVKALPGARTAADSIAKSVAMGRGDYITQAADEPFYQVHLCEDGRVEFRHLRPGMKLKEMFDDTKCTLGTVVR